MNPTRNDRDRHARPLSIAVVGSGISGLSAAWLLSQRHDVTLFEAGASLGGHSNTVDVPGRRGDVPVDTGFIVYNENTYPNLIALFDYLDVATDASDMSFSASFSNGKFEYGTANLRELFGQRRNILRPRFWRMLLGILSFYRDATRDLESRDLSGQSLKDYLAARGGDPTFVRDHLLPMAAAVWSQPFADAEQQDVADFLRFCHNHGLLTAGERPQWRTVRGGSRQYVKKIQRELRGPIYLDRPVQAVLREPDAVTVRDGAGETERFDDVVLACHADRALALLDTPSPEEHHILSPFRYRPNIAVLHSDASLMPRRRRVWSSWNFTSEGNGGDKHQQDIAVTYWMNRLQNIDSDTDYFVSLNPSALPDDAKIVREFQYEHPCFDIACRHAQRQLWSLQGKRRTWFCGSYFGAGFHEDGLQSGLAVAETLGGVKRPWHLSNPSSRIHVEADQAMTMLAQAAG